MCGIVGFTGNQNAAPILLDGLKKLEYRGYDSAGIAVLGEEGIHMVKASGRIQNLVEKTQDAPPSPAAPGLATPVGPPTGSLRMSMPIPI